MIARIEDYYDFSPSPFIRPGDIFQNLPTFGNLPVEHCPGIVVTPACDLENCKVQTITYLPILEINRYHLTRDAFRRIQKDVSNILRKTGLSNEDIQWERTSSAIQQIDGWRRSLAKDSAHLPEGVFDRCNRLLDYATAVFLSDDDFECAAVQKDISGEKAFSSNMTKLRDNSLANDTFFLPSSKVFLDTNAVTKNSLVMFRYPLTLPLEIIEMAGDIGISTWDEGVIEGILPKEQCLILGKKRPIKTQRLNFRYFSDLLSRYLSLYLRFGVPNLNELSKTSVLTEMLEGR